MKTINKIIIALAGIAFVACSDFLDTQSPSYDSGGIYESEAGLKEGVVGIYNLLYMEGTFTNSSHRPAVVTIDNFTGLRTFINNIIEKKRTGTEITDADEEIVLVPVSVYSETVSSGGSYYYYSYNEKEVVTDVVPYISAPSLALVDVDNIKLRLTYSKQDMK